MTSFDCHLFVESLVRTAKDNINIAIDLVYETIEDLLINSEYVTCDYILYLIDVEDLDPAVLISLLVITLPAKKRLRHRPRFFYRVFRLIYLSYGKKHADKVLNSLE